MKVFLGILLFLYLTAAFGHSWHEFLLVLSSASCAWAIRARLDWPTIRRW